MWCMIGLIVICSLATQPVIWVRLNVAYRKPPTQMSQPAKKFKMRPSTVILCRDRMAFCLRCWALDRLLSRINSLATRRISINAIDVCGTSQKCQWATPFNNPPPILLLMMRHIGDLNACLSWVYYYVTINLTRTQQYIILWQKKRVLNTKPCRKIEDKVFSDHCTQPGYDVWLSAMLGSTSMRWPFFSNQLIHCQPQYAHRAIPVNNIQLKNTVII